MTVIALAVFAMKMVRMELSWKNYPPHGVCPPPIVPK